MPERGVIRVHIKRTKGASSMMLVLAAAGGLVVADLKATDRRTVHDVAHGIAPLVPLAADGIK